MDAAVAIGLLWAAFMATHLALSSARVRPAAIARLGADGFRGVYSLVALGLFVPLVWIFATHKHAGPLLWLSLGPPGAARFVNHVLMGLATILVVASVLPSSTAPSAMLARGPAVARGLVRVTRHPMLAGFGLFGAAHLLVNGTLGDVLFFGGFPLFAWIGARHQDTGKAAEVRGYAGLVRATSIVPFAAVLRGRQPFVPAELPAVAIAVGLALAVLLRAYHARLFGP
jgi:uncharacterized membrane protein